MVLTIQIVGATFALFMIYYSFLKFKRNEFKIFEFWFWLICWVFVIGVSLFPQILDPIVSSMNFARRLDLVIILSFIFLTGISFFNYVSVRKNTKKLEDLVREIAIKRKK